MRHGKKFNHLGRTASHRKAMLSNMATSLVLHKRINTTLAKAKALRKYVEPLLSRAKSGSQHDRRVVYSYLQDKEAVSILFNEIADRIANRPGGYTRIIKLGSRLGDNAEMAMIELVDYNELLLSATEDASKPKRRRRKKKKADDASVEATTSAVEASDDADVEDNQSDDSSDESKSES